jgi:hypothetical protein
MKKIPLKLMVPGLVAGLVLLYAALGFLVLPAVIKSQAQQMAAAKLHRQLGIDRIAFNPFTLALSVQGFKLMEPAGGAVFFSFGRLDVDLSGRSLQRLAPVVQEVHLSAPYLHLVRRDANHYSIDDILALIASTPPSPEPARFAVNNIQLDGGAVVFDDQPAQAIHKVDDLKLGLPFISSLPTDGQIFVQPLLSAKVDGAPLLIKGRARPYADVREASVDIDLDRLDLPRYLAYLPFKPNFKLPGATLDAHLTLSFRQPKGRGAALVLGGTAAVKSLQLTQMDDQPVLKFDGLSVQLGSVDVLGGPIEIARLSLDGLDAGLSRNRDGSLNLARLLPPSPPGAVAAPQAPAAAAPRVTLKELQIHNAALRYADARPQSAMRTGVEKFDLAAHDIVADAARRSVSVGAIESGNASFMLRLDPHAPAAPSRPAAAAPAGAPYLVSVRRFAVKNWSARVQDRSRAQPLITTIAALEFAAQDFSTAPAARSKVSLKATINQGGRLALDGSVALAPFATDLALDLNNLDLLPLQPYVTGYVNLRLTQAALSSKSHLQLSSGADGALGGSFKGDVSLNRLATVDKASANDFLSWKSLSFDGMDVRLKPFSLNIARVGLTDFFARVIIDPSGRINVQDVLRSQANQDQSLTEAGVRAQSAAGARGARPPAAVPPAPSDAAPLAPIRIGKLALSGGRVRFTDNFIKPNYSADLNNLGGTVAGLSSDAASNASVDLHGAVNGAPLSIAGNVNPFKRDLSLDLKAQVQGMELAALSTYADRYVGYGIEKGKLSFEVEYRLDHRQLSADNRLVLDQLTFGSESSNPQATRLPVRLAVALLSDRNGVIDIHVPVGGSLDDPQFSIGGIVVQVIGNAITKAVTAPFAMLGSLFGGGEELSTVDFEAGRAQLPAAATGRLTTLARALTERPGLKLDITGRYDSAADGAALKRIAIERKVTALKTKDLLAHGTALPDGGVVVGKDEYPALLTRAYKDETFAKPRNALGLQKSLPVADMEQLMLANVQVGPDDLLALGNRRAQAARDWLAGSGQLPPARLFIVTAKPAGAEPEGKEPAAASRVDFALHE